MEVQDGDTDSQSDDGGSQSDLEVVDAVPVPLTPGTTRSGLIFRGPPPGAVRESRRSVTPVPNVSQTQSTRTPSSREGGAQSSANVITHTEPGHGTPAQPFVSPSHAPSRANPQNIMDQGTNPYIKVSLLVTVVCAVLYVSEIGNSISNLSSYFSALEYPVPWTPEHRIKLFNERWHEFEQAFPAQSSETKLSLLSQIESSLAEAEPTQPSAFVVLIPPEMNPCFPTRFTRRTGALINEAFQPNNPQPVKEINSSTFRKSKDITSIHDDLKAYFNSSGKAVVVRDVDKLDRTEYLHVLHAFCDNSMAHDKRATFFFLLPVSNEIYKEYKWSRSDGFYIADKILTEAWDAVLKEGSVPALISRVAANVILLNEGDSC